MQLTPRQNELLAVYLLGIGTLFMYLGYIIQGFLAESVIHTVSMRYPDVISPFAGYYGQAFHYSAFAISSLITPSVQNFIPSKWILTIASILFAVYYLGFFHVNGIYFYLSQGLMGVRIFIIQSKFHYYTYKESALYNNGEGAYLSEHSSRRTLESNTAIETAVGHSSMFVGGVALMIIFYFISSETSDNDVNLTYTDLHIQLIYGIFFILNLISVIIFAALPTKQHDSIASKSPTIVPTLKQQLNQFKTTIINVNMILLAPFFSYMGLITSFIVGVYPTTLSFTSTISSDIYIIAIYSMSMGAAEIFGSLDFQSFNSVLGGFVLRPLIKKSKDWGLILSISIHFVAISTMLSVVEFSVPENATIEPTATTALLIKPSRLVVVIIGFLCGIGDFTITMCRTVICQVALPDARMHVFSISRFYQCIASCNVLFLTRFMRVTYWTTVLAVGLTVSTITFGIVARRTAHHRKNIVLPVSNGKLSTVELV
ncbi:hypothetical protein DICVIV_09928 [Dictyocaulus viviparus]|uniref:Uncharacterized protein n=1 Tax=Dictyocaulus viviparus TaxID=29172 RepID=A0A0D8XJN2_DICVI|nr:hypothetical protein DICVIV_09928 [Dictyocaulus viviparus]